MAEKSEIASAAPLIVDAWQCIGCGRIEAPEPCVGVCQDRKVQFVYAADHERALKRLGAAEREPAAVQSLVRRLALTKPRDGERERCFRSLQEDAKRALSEVSRARSAAEAGAEREVDEEEP